MSQHDAPKRILIGFRLVDAIRDVLQGVGTFVRSKGLQWQIQCTDADQFPALLGRATADGAITVVSSRSRQQLLRLKRAGVPTVNMLHDATPELPSVLSDDIEIGRVAARELLRRGFRRFAFVGFDVPWSDHRRQGFAEVLGAEGHTPEHCEATAKIRRFAELAKKSTDRSLSRWVTRLEKPIGILAASDAVGSRVLSACLASNAAVPGEVALIGVDNLVHTCEFAPVPMSSVAQDFERLGFEAAALLHRLMTRQVCPTGAVTVPPGIMVARRSTDVFAFDDDHVAAAMRMIHGSPSGVVHMKEVLSRIAVSRRWLDARFKALVGHPVSEEIRRHRLDRLQQLLLHTDMSIKQIALQSGFSRPENMVRFFRDAIGVPPQAYRQGRHAGEAAARK
jgi:LacI family transcriptional regulator